MHHTALDDDGVGLVLAALAPAAELFLTLSPHPSHSVVDNPTGFPLLAERALQIADQQRRRSEFDDVVRPALVAALEAIRSTDDCIGDRDRYGTVAWLKGCIESALA